MGHSGSGPGVWDIVAAAPGTRTPLGSNALACWKQETARVPPGKWWDPGARKGKS